MPVFINPKLASVQAEILDLQEQIYQMQEERHEHQSALNQLPHRPKLGSEKTAKAKHEWDIDALTKAIS